MQSFFLFQQQLLCILANAMEVVALAAGFLTLVVMAIYAAGKQNKKATRLTLAALGLLALGLAMPGLVSQVIGPAEAANMFVLSTLSFLNLVLGGVLVVIIAARSILARSILIEDKRWIYIWNAAAILGGPPWAIALFLTLRGLDSGEATQNETDSGSAERE